ncbi:helix-turn-helix domain-containing protein [Pseudonocardia alaniniphila]|uniref:Helix-turn-helix domain-containing protein n=1 Tax=Pseudonocardia alaniniphila TaxID=75291 RepID=A0ABS9TC93_9PSEU|nr:helix-turn-helix domain-containing protein [Pseudonocardia alaniniphila]MCH6166164.1 helix-turn-helix domain-containing protein [Pseudonocardia alaniniphila]
MQIHEFYGEELEDVASESFMPVTASTRPEYHGCVAFQELGDAMTLSRSQWGGPMSSVRTDRMAARATGDNVMLFCVQIAGRVYIRQHDRFAELTAGSGVLSEARSSWKRVSPTAARSLALRFSRELLPLRTVEITEACARSVDSANPAMQMLSTYLRRLFQVADDLTGDQLDAGRAAIDLLAMVLRDVSPSTPGADGAAEVLLDVMRMHVREHLADPELRVEELARRHHVSVARLYTLFERIGTTPGAYLREQRLLAAQAMLSDPRYDRAISSIAAAVGFRDVSTFVRAFRREFGTTPTGWRREHFAGLLP